MANPPPSPRPPSWKVWLIASRPHTLTASLSPVIVGSYATSTSLSFDDHRKEFRLLMLQWASFCMLMQLGTNLHNDYADFVKGADTEKRVGQARATQRGWLTPRQTATAACTVLTVGLALGINFLFQISNHHEKLLSFTSSTSSSSSTPSLSLRLGIMAAIVVTSIFNAFAYTGGPFPLGYIGLGNVSIGYSGLGDVFVFLYFGLVATLMIPFLYWTTIVPMNIDDTLLVEKVGSVLHYAIQVALLATNIIVVNNLRDRHTDVEAHKRTLAVRFGAKFCRMQYASQLLAAYALVLWDVYNGEEFAWSRFLPLVSLPIALKELKAVYEKDGKFLNPHVGGAAKVQFLFSLLLSIGMKLSRQ